jgi:hypothetical protein
LPTDFSYSHTLSILSACDIFTDILAEMDSSDKKRKSIKDFLREVIEDPASKFSGNAKALFMANLWSGKNN